ncbi:hypothetical protein HY468_00305 [Candidatus Roizmanbacteria bacterium]|nr:hypothetical protein [Candidatus Roizmanbacteria bacterium]
MGRLLVILFITAVAGSMWQLYLHNKLSQTTISCGGDFSYQTVCPTGSYCTSMNQGPFADGTCIAYLSPFFASLSSLSPTNLYKDGRCSLKAVAGRCKACFPSYYYNQALKTCEQTCDGGCGDGVVPFQTLDECLQVCKR